jgi:homocysteine S-methyltransferase
MFSIVRSVHKDGIILIAQPAAGIPTFFDGRSVYHATPEYLAQYARELVESGVTLIGACCGSTPAHIKAIVEAVKGLKVGKKEAKPPARPSVSIRSEPETIYAEPPRRSKFGKNIGKKFLTTVELDIPRGLDMRTVIEGAQSLYERGIDAINITDGARARLRMDAISISLLVQQKVGIETITHQTARDRNMIAAQSELLGAHALGLRNILCVSGDPAQIGDYPQATSVLDVDSVGLIRAVASMNRGTDIMGNPIGEPTWFTIACAVNPAARDFDKEIEKLERKVEAGAQIAFTQPLYEMKTLENLVRRIEYLRLPIMLGLLPLRSYKHADFLHNEVPGIVIPEKIREELRHADDAGKVGIRQTKELLREAKPLVAGAYTMPPFQKYHLVDELLEVIR